MAGFQAIKNWMSNRFGSAVQKTAPVDAEAVVAAVSVLLEKDFELSASKECVALMQAVEQQFFVKDYYRYPFYFWKPRLSDGAKKQFREGWQAAFARHEDVSAKMTILALAGRIAPPNDKFAAALNKVVEMDWSRLGDALAEEFCALLQAQRKYEILCPAAEAFLKRPTLEARQKMLLCDFYVQAAYQRLKKKVFQNILNADDLALMRAVVDTCGKILGRECANMRHYQGLVACMENDLEAAVKHHEQARILPGYNTQFFRAGLNMVSLATMHTLAATPTSEFAENPAFFQEIIYKFRHGSGGDATLLACDETYFKAYAAGFCRSYGALNPGKVLHIHAIGFEPSETELDKLETDFGVAINVSLDPGPAQDITNDLRRGYCAGARYIHLPTYLDHYSRIIVNDIDGIVHRSFDDVWSGHGGKVLLSTLVLEADRKGHFAFWSNIGAGAFGIESIPSHRQFAQALANFLTRRFNECDERDERFFFSDQVGLLLCVLAFKGQVPMIRMPQVFRQSTQTSQVGRDAAKKDAQSALFKSMVEGKSKAVTE